MRCNKTMKLISRRLDGALSPRLAGALDAHLAACGRCTSEAGRVERAWSLLAASAPPARAPDDFEAIATLAGAPRRRWSVAFPSWDWAPAPRLAAGVIAVCALLGTSSGLLLSRSAFAGHDATPALEAAALAEGFGDLPFGSPAGGFARTFTSPERMP